MYTDQIPHFINGLNQSDYVENRSLKVTVTHTLHTKMAKQMLFFLHVGVLKCKRHNGHFLKCLPNGSRQNGTYQYWLNKHLQIFFISVLLSS